MRVNVVCVPSVFFFQAEDGIRDLVRSRGLGDVYKRQGEIRQEPEHDGNHVVDDRTRLDRHQTRGLSALELSLIHI